MIATPVHFMVLYDERSKRDRPKTWARGPDPVPAHEDERCLACPTAPRLEPRSKETAWMNQDGVGCETCHGSAKKWLGMHTSRDWKSISPADKQYRYGIHGYERPSGAPDRALHRLPRGRPGRAGRPTFARRVNHDLIAAGHPRLNFEFAAYQENQPKHWKTNKPESAEAAADFPARAWALGQLVSAKAALELLGSRSARALAMVPPALPPALPGPVPAHSPWPEFAEYGCFSCHHSLAVEPWRRNRLPSGVPIGVPAWGSWYHPTHHRASR